MWEVTINPEIELVQLHQNPLPRIVFEAWSPIFKGS